MQEATAQQLSVRTNTNGSTTCDGGWADGSPTLAGESVSVSQVHAQSGVVAVNA